MGLLMLSPITIIYAFDQHYAQYAAVSTYSLVFHSKSALQIYWLVPDTDASSVEPIAANLTKKTGVEIRVLPVSMSELGTWKQSYHYTQAMYLRLLIPGLIDQPRAIYLDADTLVLSDLGELHSLDFGSALIAGVPDSAGPYLTAIPLRNGDPYINSGVLLMNLDALRQDEMLTKARTIYFEHEHRLIFPDQCVINKYAEGRKLTLDESWNRQIVAMLTNAVEFESIRVQANPSIMHFTHMVKPWHAWCEDYISDFWWHYADRAEIDGLVRQRVTTIGQAIKHADMLERFERHQESSEKRRDIIDRLVEIVDELQHRTTQATVNASRRSPEKSRKPLNSIRGRG
jgi:lipopolysaccharide biosynthesis glycosyltransferase